MEWHLALLLWTLTLPCNSTNMMMVEKPTFERENEWRMFLLLSTLMSSRSETPSDRFWMSGGGSVERGPFERENPQKWQKSQKVKVKKWQWNPRPTVTLWLWSGGGSVERGGSKVGRVWMLSSACSILQVVSIFFQKLKYIFTGHKCIGSLSNLYICFYSWKIFHRTESDEIPGGNFQHRWS